MCVVRSISKSTLQRLPIYLSFLKQHCDSEFVSATVISKALSLNDVQVRKDLAAISSSGRPKVGYCRCTLILELENFLGYNDNENAVIIGVGNLGTALLNYEGFEQYGLQVIAGFDIDESKIDEKRKIFHISKLKDLCKRLNIHIGIITVNVEQAQLCCDELVDAGITAIWNFAPTHLNVPSYVHVQRENMAASLAILSRHIKDNKNN
ncbi:MAG: redox-sensing transcriptional repressor Rex [Clostridiales bacterium]|nr:redox-sensing transcriptional repressor Rex [Clostridiales bacterium]